jgi:hypothetical protein
LVSNEAWLLTEATMTAPADTTICTVDGCSITTSRAIAEPVIAGNLLLFSGAQRTPLIVKTLRRIAPAQAAAQADLDGAQADARA